MNKVTITVKITGPGDPGVGMATEFNVTEAASSRTRAVLNNAFTNIAQLTLLKLKDINPPPSVRQWEVLRGVGCIAGRDHEIWDRFVDRQPDSEGNKDALKRSNRRHCNCPMPSDE